MATLSVIATPIGNLEDITLRALRTLKEADVIVAEDTRVTRKLLNHFEIKTSAVAFHEFSDPRRIQGIADHLREGKHVAIVTDAGTPGISDPGAFLIGELLRSVPETVIATIPGPSALTAALAVSGFRAEPFTFFGFPPQKKGRKTFFETLSGREETLVFFESPHRIEKTLRELAEAVGAGRLAYVGRELTKIHESHYRGTLAEVTEAVSRDTIRGEYVIVIAKA